LLTENAAPKPMNKSAIDPVIGQGDGNASANRYQVATGVINSFTGLCSADLAVTSAFYNRATGKGTTARLSMTGEEAGSKGRAYAFIATGTNKGHAYELPGLGKFS
jgi:hypothetical protein